MFCHFCPVLRRRWGEIGSAMTLGRNDSIGVLGFNDVIYPPWTSRLLMGSSIVMGCSSAFAGVLHQYILCTLSGLSAVASINYWRKPGPGCRRDGDYCFAALALAYTVPASLSLRGTPNVCFWACLTAFYLCFRRSFQLSSVSNGGDGRWAQWHAAGHTFVSIGTSSAALGEVDSWRFDHFNPLGTLISMLICSRLAYDTWRAYSQNSRRNQIKEIALPSSTDVL